MGGQNGTAERGRVKRESEKGGERKGGRDRRERKK
jgi:hypothetical protein